ncbi:hypothetical protein [Virgibacillus dokdonensis]|uniref:hypothetical protein n=1 Tax=Virgibacillus dokdonensis TaxID=302167 RepID=UPI00098A8E36|nr:hypothetical protein [Virgibacillus dokdonensis]
MNDAIEQTHVYEYLGKENDPIYEDILRVKVNHSLLIPETKLKVTKNRYGMYEIVSDEQHECYSSPQSLYDRISALLNAISHRR